MSDRYLQLDVFANRLGGGNPLGTVVDAAAWSATQMQAFASWTNLVETTFVLPPTDSSADYRLRIFTPQREIAFAGHPTIGSAHALLELGVVTPRDGQLIQQCEGGLLPIRIEAHADQSDLFVRAPKARVLATGIDAHPQLAPLLTGIPLGRLQPAFVEGGRRWWVAEIADEATLRGWHPDHAAIRALALASDSLGLCVFARSHAAGEVVVRAFPAGAGIVEDPASGAANGLIAAYIRHSEPMGSLAQGYRVSQGREIGRDARILVEIEDAHAIWVGGSTHTIISGHTHWATQTSA